MRGAMIPVERTLHQLLLRNFPEEYKKRSLMARTEEAPSRPAVDTNATNNETGATDGNFDEIPIFICGLAFPGIAFPLHVFEPRYRLMMRRCIEDGSRVFGMVMHTGNGSGSEYGTLLKIEDFEQLRDGRSRVDTIGVRRFRVLQYGEKDGYSTGKVEYIEDNIELSSAEVAEISSISNAVKSLVESSGHGHVHADWKIPTVDEVDASIELFLMSDIFGLQISHQTKYEFFGDEFRADKKRGCKNFENCFKVGLARIIDGYHKPGDYACPTIKFVCRFRGNLLERDTGQTSLEFS